VLFQQAPLELEDVVAQDVAYRVVEGVDAHGDVALTVDVELVVV
jgi:hypothetical protein